MTPQRAQELEAELRRRAQLATDGIARIGDDMLAVVQAAYVVAYKEAADLVRDAAKGE